MLDLGLLRSKIKSQFYGTLTVLESGGRSGAEVESAVDNRPLRKKILGMGRRVILVGYAGPIEALSTDTGS